MSESTADILNEIGGYHLDFRGETELKGKGTHKTYWLTGKDGFDKELPQPFISDNNHGIDKALIEHLEKLKEERAKQEKEMGGTVSIVAQSDEQQMGSSQTLPKESLFKAKVNDIRELNQQRKLSTKSATSNKQSSTSNLNNGNNTLNAPLASTSLNNSASNLESVDILPMMSMPTSKRGDAARMESMKNDSGFSESTSNGTPTSKMNGSLNKAANTTTTNNNNNESANDSKSKKTRLTDIESVA